MFRQVAVLYEAQMCRMNGRHRMLVPDERLNSIVCTNALFLGVVEVSYVLYTYIYEHPKKHPLHYFAGEEEHSLHFCVALILTLLFQNGKLLSQRPKISGFFEPEPRKRSKISLCQLIPVKNCFDYVVCRFFPSSFFQFLKLFVIQFDIGRL